MPIQFVLKHSQIPNREPNTDHKLEDSELISIGEKKANFIMLWAKIIFEFLNLAPKSFDNYLINKGIQIIKEYNRGFVEKRFNLNKKEFAELEKFLPEKALVAESNGHFLKINQWHQVYQFKKEIEAQGQDDTDSKHWFENFEEVSNVEAALEDFTIYIQVMRLNLLFKENEDWLTHKEFAEYLQYITDFDSDSDPIGLLRGVLGFGRALPHRKELLKAVLLLKNDLPKTVEFYQKNPFLLVELAALITNETTVDNISKQLREVQETFEGQLQRFQMSGSESEYTKHCKKNRPLGAILENASNSLKNAEKIFNILNYEEYFSDFAEKFGKSFSDSLKKYFIQVNAISSGEINFKTLPEFTILQRLTEIYAKGLQLGKVTDFMFLIPDLHERLMVNSDQDLLSIWVSSKDAFATVKENYNVELWDLSKEFQQRFPKLTNDLLRIVRKMEGEVSSDLFKEQLNRIEEFYGKYDSLGISQLFVAAVESEFADLFNEGIDPKNALEQISSQLTKNQFEILHKLKAQWTEEKHVLSVNRFNSLLEKFIKSSDQNEKRYILDLETIKGFEKSLQRYVVNKRIEKFGKYTQAIVRSYLEINEGNLLEGATTISESPFFKASLQEQYNMLIPAILSRMNRKCSVFTKEFVEQHIALTGDEKLSVKDLESKVAHLLRLQDWAEFFVSQNQNIERSSDYASYAKEFIDAFGDEYLIRTLPKTETEKVQDVKKLFSWYVDVINKKSFTPKLFAEVLSSYIEGKQLHSVVESLGSYLSILNESQDESMILANYLLEKAKRARIIEEGKGNHESKSFAKVLQSNPMKIASELLPVFFGNVIQDKKFQAEFETVLYQIAPFIKQLVVTEEFQTIINEHGVFIDAGFNVLTDLIEALPEEQRRVVIKTVKGIINRNFVTISGDKIGGFAQPIVNLIVEANKLNIERAKIKDKEKLKKFDANLSQIMQGLLFYLPWATYATPLVDTVVSAGASVIGSKVTQWAGGFAAKKGIGLIIDEMKILSDDQKTDLKNNDELINAFQRLPEILLPLIPKIKGKHNLSFYTNVVNEINGMIQRKTPVEPVEVALKLLEVVKHFLDNDIANYEEPIIAVISKLPEIVN